MRAGEAHRQAPVPARPAERGSLLASAMAACLALAAPKAAQAAAAAAATAAAAELTAPTPAPAPASKSAQAALLLPAATPAPSTAGLAAPAPPASTPIFSASGRIVFGSAWRLEAPDSRLPFAANGAAAGVAAINGTGANADDANLNFRRHDAVSRALAAALAVQARWGDGRARLSLKAWHDYALSDDRRSWGNAANGYAAGAPLSDAGAPPLSRFAGVVVDDAWVEQGIDAGRWRLLGRAGQQTLDWGTRSSMGGGLDVLGARDLPAARRPGAMPSDARVPLPMLFASARYADAIAIEGFYQTHFRPNAIDMCGSFGAVNDYLVDGCDKVMSGAPAVNDRARVALGAYLRRLPTPKPQASQFGLALRWKLAALGLELGAYHARYTSRMAVPGLRKSSRVGPAFIAGDPDGRNLAFFTEYPEALRIDAMTFAARGGAYGELSYRPRQPLLFGPGDAVPPFLNPAAPALLRADVDATAPGALFHGYESYPMWQASLGLARPASAATAIGFSAELVAKHVVHLPDQALRRFGRSDLFGTGPVKGVCNVNMSVPALQCSQRGYVSRDAVAWRARLDARLPPLLPALTTTASLGFTYDVHGWSADYLINQGRRSASLALRAEFRQRYQFEINYLPVWGGDYNAGADRDVLAVAVGVKF